MVAEKNAAFIESWNAMAVQTLLANQALAASFFKSFFTVAQGKKLSAARSAAQFQRAGAEGSRQGLGARASKSNCQRQASCAYKAALDLHRVEIIRSLTR